MLSPSGRYVVYTHAPIDKPPQTYIRTAATVAQQLRERQLAGRSDDDVLALIAGERARRATNLCLEVASDMDAAKNSKQPRRVMPT